MAYPLLVPEYPACKHIQRNKTDVPISEDVLETISKEADVLPLFEQKVYHYKVMKRSSLQRNELLKCRWAEFMNRLQGRVKTPFIFPSVYDLHFHKFLVRYDPSQSICNRKTNRFSLKVGPGVDKFGQMPIPDDMQLRKTEKENVIKKDLKNHQEVDSKNI